MVQAPSITKRVEAVRALTGAVRSAVPPIPKSVKIELTAQCNLRCFFCAAHKRPRDRSEMSPALFLKLARALRSLGFEQLGLFYIGESLLCDWLPEAVHHAKHACGYPYVFLTTNGLAATPERVKSCMLAGLDSLKFAFNWAGPEQFQAVTGLPRGGFATVLANVTAARRVRDEVERETGHRCALYASSLAYDPLQKQRMSGPLAEIQSAVDEHYWLPLLGHRGLPGEEPDTRPVPVKSLPCWPLFTEAHITWDGRLSACCLDASARFHMGEVNEASFLEAWHSAGFQALREAHLEHDLRGTVCEKCVAY